MAEQLIGRESVLVEDQYLDGRLSKKPTRWWGRGMQAELGTRVMTALVIEARGDWPLALDAMEDPRV